MSHVFYSLKSAGVKETIRQGKKLSFPPFRVYVLPHTNEKIGVTIIIAKKICKHATKRNRIRRCIREAMRVVSLTKADYVFYLTQDIVLPSKKIFQSLFETHPLTLS